MSKHIARRAPARNKTNDLPDLFSWRSAIHHRPSTHAGQYVMRRYRVSPHTAEVIAALAGLGSEVPR
jgi:hypothetical protein